MGRRWCGEQEGAGEMGRGRLGVMWGAGGRGRGGKRQTWGDVGSRREQLTILHHLAAHGVVEAVLDALQVAVLQESFLLANGILAVITLVEVPRVAYIAVHSITCTQPSHG